MGLYDIIILGEDVELPEWPFEETNVGWQTKQIGRPFMGTYKIEDNRLLRKEEEVETKELSDAELEEKIGEDASGPLAELARREREVTDEWWVDHNHHGSFEFHTSYPEEINTDDKFPTREGKEWWSYEARFTKGELEKIVLLDHYEMGD